MRGREEEEEEGREEKEEGERDQGWPPWALPFLSDLPISGPTLFLSSTPISALLALTPSVFFALKILQLYPHHYQHTSLPGPEEPTQGRILSGEGGAWEQGDTFCSRPINTTSHLWAHHVAAVGFVIGR